MLTIPRSQQTWHNYLLVWPLGKLYLEFRGPYHLQAGSYFLCEPSSPSALAFLNAQLTLYITQLPQLIENVRNENAEGISTAFLLIWLAGDITNLIGGCSQLRSYQITPIQTYYNTSRFGMGGSSTHSRCIGRLLLLRRLRASFPGVLLQPLSEAASYQWGRAPVFTSSSN